MFFILVIDFEMPRKRGLSAWLVKQCKMVRYDDSRYLKGEDAISFQRLEKIIDVSIPNQKSLSFNGTLNSLLHLYKSWPKGIKISQLLNRAGIEETIEVKHLLSEYGLNNNEVFSYNDLTKDFRIISLFNDLRPLILKKAKIQHGYFMKYFLQAASGDVIAMVDSGGRCIIEDALRTLLKGSECNHELYGFYLLLDVEENNHRQAWLNKQT